MDKSQYGEKHYSVLMSVYYKDDPVFFGEAMDSIWNQTVPTDDFVLVCDGPLTEELDQVIEGMLNKHGDILNVVRLEKNGGLGNALNVGIKYCRHDLVARMDSDDISRPYRCEKQLEAFRQMPDLSVISGIVEEFTDSTDNVYAKRAVPETHESIVKFAKSRNPFNHPCVMYDKNAVEAAGGYQDFYLLEDYYLWVRMLLAGFRGYNLQIPLLWMRAGSDLYKRRSGLKYAVSQYNLFSFMRKEKFISNAQFLKSLMMRTASSLVPNGIRELMFKSFLRK